MTVLTPDEQTNFDYIQSVYPTGLRSKAFEQDSLTWKYDYVRASTLTELLLSVKAAVARLEVSTADIYWIEERENFLVMPVDTSLSLEVRRTKVLTRLSGNDATIKNLKIAIESFTWNVAWAYRLIELRKEAWFVADDTRTYVVDLYNPPTTLDISALTTALTEIQPAHCLLVIWRTIPILDSDAVWVHDVVEHATNREFIRWINWAPAWTDVIRSWWDYIEWGSRTE